MQRFIWLRLRENLRFSHFWPITTILCVPRFFVCFLFPNAYPLITCYAVLATCLSHNNRIFFFRFRSVNLVYPSGAPAPFAPGFFTCLSGVRVIHVVFFFSSAKQ
jgi:hypothetical protein